MTRLVLARLCVLLLLRRAGLVTSPSTWLAAQLSCSVTVACKLVYEYLRKCDNLSVDMMLMAIVPRLNDVQIDIADSKLTVLVDEAQIISRATKSLGAVKPTRGASTQQGRAISNDDNAVTLLSPVCQGVMDIMCTPSLVLIGTKLLMFETDEKVSGLAKTVGCVKPGNTLTLRNYLDSEAVQAFLAHYWKVDHISPSVLEKIGYALAGRTRFVAQFVIHLANSVPNLRLNDAVLLAQLKAFRAAVVQDIIMRNIGPWFSGDGRNQLTGQQSLDGQCYLGEFVQRLTSRAMVYGDVSFTSGTEFDWLATAFFLIDATSADADGKIANVVYRLCEPLMLKALVCYCLDKHPSGELATLKRGFDEVLERFGEGVAVKGA
eukprot:TRINITY_DN7178_c1_g4_i1.p1 TRINITY_DN7178_c1_g4~~TRINITY_DN7178_c1_g4_i1.p1  ORF type:complete len:377 (+),score=71.51 TRINITY_DN7178_c1_g4_i1:650-1780(+)